LEEREREGEALQGAMPATASQTGREMGATCGHERATRTCMGRA